MEGKPKSLGQGPSSWSEKGEAERRPVWPLCGGPGPGDRVGGVSGLPCGRSLQGEEFGLCFQCRGKLLKVGKRGTHCENPHLRSSCRSVLKS